MRSPGSPSSSRRSRPKADVNIGKRGITEELLEELKRRLKSQKRVKVRINRNALASGLSRKDVAREVAQRLGARLVEVRGRTFVLERVERGGGREVA